MFKKILILLLLLMLTSAAMLVIAVQPFFIRAVILPRLEAVTDTSIEVESFSLAPFSRLEVEKGRIRKLDGSFEFEFDSFTVGYDLMKILRGTVEMDQIVLLRPELRLRLDPDAKAPIDMAADKTKADVSDLRIHIRNVQITDGRVRLILPKALVDLEDVQLRVPELRNGGILRPQFDTRLRVMQSNQPDVQKVEGTISSTMEIQLSDSLKPLSFSGGFTAGVRHAELEGRELQIQFHSEMGINPEAKSFQVRALTGQAQLAGQQILDLSLRAPMEVDASESPIRLSDTELQFDMGPFQVSDLPFAEFIPVQSAAVELRSRLQVTESGNQIAATAKISVKRLQGQFQGVDLSNWEFDGQADLAGSADEVNWKDVRALLTYKEEPFLDLRSSGSSKLSFEDGDATVHFSSVPLKVLAELLPDFPVGEGAVSGSSQLRWTAEPEVSFRMDLEGTGLNLDGDKVLPSPLQLNLVGSATPETLRLRMAQFAWPATEGYQNRLTASGTVDWQDVDAVETHLEITGEALDVKPWHFPSEEKEAVSGEAPVTASVPEELKLPLLPLKPSTLSLRVAALRLDKLLIRDLILDVGADRQQLEFKPLNFKLNESEFTSQGRFDWSDSLAAYELKADLMSLRIQPVIDSLLPEMTGMVSGFVQGGLQLSGKGTTLDAVREHLRGELTVSLREG
jgi:uncharacterized protein involved in outer membrane biogenesis